MTTPHILILYVDNAERSAAFYAGLLDKTPVEASPTFAMFGLENGMMLGLWSRHTALPAPLAAAGGSELAFTVGADEQVDAQHADWADRGVAIAQPPTRLDFGYTFVALDPDGHRLRVFAPGMH